MAKLILSLEGSVIREIPLDKDRITIGRKAQNDIPIENLVVNGNQVKKHILQNNDVIEIGKYKMKYVVESAGSGGGAAAPADDFEKTMVMRSPARQPAAPKPAPPA